MNLDIFTLFPEAFDWFRQQRPVRKAIEHGAELNLRDYRDWTPLKGGRVDDAPYGGGAGMVLRVDVVDAARSGVNQDHVAWLDPMGSAQQILCRHSLKQ